MRNIIICLVALVVFSGCGDLGNKIDRKAIEYIDRDYKVTTTTGFFEREWDVKDGKITSDPEKGYYLFWATIDGDSDEKYVQVPIKITIIEEM